MKDSSQIPVIRRLLGSIVPGHVYLFHGDRGVGKTVLGMQLAQSWIRGGGLVLYLSTVRPTEFFQHAADLGLPLEAYWQCQQLILGEYGPRAASQFRELGAEAFLDRVAEAAQDLPVAGVVVDTLDPLIDTVSNRVQLREQLTALVDGLSRRGWTTLLLCGGKILEEKGGAGSLLRDLCWATVSMQRCRPSLWDRVRGETPAGSLILKIEKARQPTPSGAELPCEIVQGAGLLPVPEPARAADRIVPQPMQTDLPKVLFISPDPGFFDGLADLLEGTARVQTVADGVEGLSRAVTWSPQVILAESAIPRLSGFGIARALRQGHYGMPIILISRNNRRHSERVRAYLNGATDFLCHPFDARELVYKVRVMSQMSLHTFERGIEEQMMDVLLSNARSHILSVPAFLQALSLSLCTGGRLAAPVTLIGFSFEGSEPEANAGVWERFRDLIDTQARNGDLICLPAPHRAAVLLCHETERGADAFGRRVRRELTRAGLHGVGRPASWQIAIASSTIQLPHGEQPDLRQILDGAFEPSRPFMIGGQDASETGLTKRTTLDPNPADAGLRESAACAEGDDSRESQITAADLRRDPPATESDGPRRRWGT